MQTQTTLLYKFETTDCKDVECSPCIVACETLNKYCLENGLEIGYEEINKLFITPEKMYMYAYISDIDFFYRKLLFWLSDRIVKCSAVLEDTQDKYNFIKSKLSVKFYIEAVE